MKLLAPLLALLLLASCGSKEEDLAEEEPVPGAPGDGSENIPRLLAPPLPAGPSQAMPNNPFRVPEVTGELPEEKTLLSRPVTAPETGDDLNTQ
jgi:hypothetical protein